MEKILIKLEKMNEIKIGIRDCTENKENNINKVFNNIKPKLKNKGYTFEIKVEDYDKLRGKIIELDGEFLLKFEESNMKAMSDSTKEIILFNNTFFECKQETVKWCIFLHEIGHIINKGIETDNYMIKSIYNEYLSDKFLF